MKLSEILSKPIKLKGGGLLNLKGFNKRIIDKEIYSQNNNNVDNLLFEIEPFSDLIIKPVFGCFSDSKTGNTIIKEFSYFKNKNISFNFVYKISDFNNINTEENINVFLPTHIKYDIDEENKISTIEAHPIEFLDKDVINEDYCYLYKGISQQQEI